MEIKDKIFREYDIRGVFGTEEDGADLTVELTETLGRAVTRLIKERSGKDKVRVSIGRDVRLSSPMVRDALIKGLTESGADCVDLGSCPTPLQYFSLHTMELDGGVMITGSHNPPEYNGFKISVGKETIHGAEIQELKEIVKEIAAEGEEAAHSSAVGTVEGVDIISSYVQWVVKNLSLQKKIDRPIKVVLDGGNGTAGLVAPALMRELGCDVVELYCDPDGSFPNHHPDPTVEENLTDLIERVKKEGADFGVGFDGDADRIGVVDEKGGVVWGDQLMVVFARHILEGTPGATVVGEVKCSQLMYDEIERAGGKAVMWKTGHSLIKSRMKELGAALAGEMSGHIFFADRFFGFDDAVYAACRIAEIMAEKRVKDKDAVFSALLHGLDGTVTTPEIRVDCSDEEKFAVTEKLKDAVAAVGKEGHVKDVVTIDGIRVIFDGGWALVRASNTQPVLVMRFEATDEKLLREYKDFMKARLDEVKPGIWDGA